MGDAKPKKLHNRSVKHVTAGAQAECYFRIKELLSEEETAIFKSGRNSKTGHSPRNTAVVNYRLATGFETLIGYLYMKGDKARLYEIMEHAFDDSVDSHSG